MQFVDRRGVCLKGLLKNYLKDKIYNILTNNRRDNIV